jgi:hypothetical protein
MLMQNELPSGWRTLLVATGVLSAWLTQATVPVAGNTVFAQLPPSAPTSDVLENLDTQPDSTDELVIDALTDEQVAQIESVFQTYQPQIAAARGEYLQALVVLNDLLVPETADLALVDAHDDVVAAEDAINDLIFKRNLAIRSVLTLEQRQAINDYMRDWLGLGPGNPAAVFPMNLLGRDIDAAIAALEADGWTVVVTTPGYVALDRGDQKLDLEFNQDDQIETANLAD